MVYLFLVALLIVIAGVGVFIAGLTFSDGHGRPAENVPVFKIRTGILAVLALFLIVITAACSTHQVPTGEVGLTSTFGKIDGKTAPSAGLIFTLPWQSFDTEDIRVRREQLKDPLAAASLESQNVYIRTTVNFHIDPENVVALRQRVAGDVFSTIVEPKLVTAVKEETIKYNAIDILPNREKIRTAVKAKLESQVAAFGVTVDDVLFDNIDFSDQFEAAIESKQTATQNALAELEKVEVEKNHQQAELEKAKGERRSAEERATGQANANNTINASLTDRILQAAAIDKLAGNIQVALIPSGQGLILDPSSLLAPKK